MEPEKRTIAIVKECYGRIFRWQVGLEGYWEAREVIRQFIAKSTFIRQLTPLGARRFISNPAIVANKSEKLLWPGMARAGFLMTTGKWMKPPIGGFIHEQRIAESNCGYTCLFH